jgi:hypothetical protein
MGKIVHCAGVCTITCGSGWRALYIVATLLTSGPLGEEPKVSDEGAAMQTLCLLGRRKWRVDSNPVVVRMASGVLAAVACLGADAANRHAVRATFSTHQLSTHQLEMKTS